MTTASPGEASVVPEHERLHRDSPDAAVDAALGALRAGGERVTVARRAVLEALARTHEHLGAEEVAALLETTHPGVHRASVYRTLELLTRLGIATHVHGGGGTTVYHLAAAALGHEHLHAHCRECGEVVVVPADVLDAAASRVHAESGFRLDPGRSALVGLCAGCAAG